MATELKSYGGPGVMEDTNVPQDTPTQNDQIEDLDTPERAPSGSSGPFLPRILHHTTVPFRFEFTELREGTTKDGKPWQVIVFTAHVPTHSVPPNKRTRTVNQAEMEIRFNEVTSFQVTDSNSKKSISGIGKLFRSLGLDKKHSVKTTGEMIDILRVTHGLHGRGQIGWRAHTQISPGVYERYSTHPFRKRGDLEWPGNEPEVTFSNKEVKPGREFIAAIYAPLKDA